MRYILASLFTTCAMVALTSSAHAKTNAVDSAFFVQLGTAENESIAQEKWEHLKTEYPTLLEKLDFAPRSIIPVSGGAAEYRMEAGPTASREAAQRICAQLMAKSVDCFIVEAAVFNGAPSRPRNTVAAIPMETPLEDVSPAMHIAESGAPAPAAPITALTESDEEFPSVPTPSGHVEVSEAVAVSPSTEHNASTPGFNGRVRVSGFDNEQKAYDFYQELYKELGAKIGKRVHISRALIANSPHSGVMLSLNAANDDAITSICSTATERQLGCNREAMDTTAVADASSTSAADSSPAANSPFSVVKASHFWVQLGSWGSEEEAQSHFDAVRDHNHKILAAYDATISPLPEGSKNASKTVRLRVGPFAQRTDARRMCNRLHARGTSCLVVRDSVNE